ASASGTDSRDELFVGREHLTVDEGRRVVGGQLHRSRADSAGREVLGRGAGDAERDGGGGGELVSRAHELHAEQTPTLLERPEADSVGGHEASHVSDLEDRHALTGIVVAGGGLNDRGGFGVGELSGLEGSHGETLSVWDLSCELLAGGEIAPGLRLILDYSRVVISTTFFSCIRTAPEPATA